MALCALYLNSYDDLMLDKLPVKVIVVCIYTCIREGGEADIATYI